MLSVASLEHSSGDLRASHQRQLADLVCVGARSTGIQALQVEAIELKESLKLLQLEFDAGLVPATGAPRERLHDDLVDLLEAHNASASERVVTCVLGLRHSFSAEVAALASHLQAVCSESPLMRSQSEMKARIATNVTSRDADANRSPVVATYLDGEQPPQACSGPRMVPHCDLYQRRQSNVEVTPLLRRSAESTSRGATAISTCYGTSYVMRRACLGGRRSGQGGAKRSRRLRSWCSCCRVDFGLNRR